MNISYFKLTSWRYHCETFGCGSPRRIFKEYQRFTWWWFFLVDYIWWLWQKVISSKMAATYVWTRWVSVVKFHDPTLIIGKVFGQESTVVKWNYQIFGLQVTVCQKLGVILVIKWFKNWSQQKMFFTKKVRLNWYSSMNFFLERFGWFLT